MGQLPALQTPYAQDANQMWDRVTVPFRRDLSASESTRALMGSCPSADHLFAFPLLCLTPPAMCLLASIRRFGGIPLPVPLSESAFVREFPQHLSAVIADVRLSGELKTDEMHLGVAAFPCIRLSPVDGEHWRLFAETKPLMAWFSDDNSVIVARQCRSSYFQRLRTLQRLVAIRPGDFILIPRLPADSLANLLLADLLISSHVRANRARPQLDVLDEPHSSYAPFDRSMIAAAEYLCSFPCPSITFLVARHSIVDNHALHRTSLVQIIGPREDCWLGAARLLTSPLDLSSPFHALSPGAVAIDSYNGDTPLPVTGELIFRPSQLAGVRSTDHRPTSCTSRLTVRSRIAVTQHNQSVFSVLGAVEPRQRRILVVHRSTLADDGLPSTQGNADGIRVPLLPTQNWLLDRELDHLAQYNLVYFFNLPRIDPSNIAGLLRALLRLHPSLTARYRRVSGQWEQRIDLVSSESIDRKQLFRLHVVMSDSEIADACFAARNTLGIDKGPAFLLFDRREHKGWLLALIVHHLSFDAISAKVLKQSIQELLAPSRLAQPLPTRESTSIWRLVCELETYANTDAALRELCFWRSQPWNTALRMPLVSNDSADDNTYGSSTVASLRLSRDEMTHIYRRVIPCLKVGLNAIVLHALQQAAGDLFGTDALMVDLTGNGREGFPSGLNLRTTVGLLATTFPFLVHSIYRCQPRDAVRATQAMLDAVPNWGTGFNALKYSQPRGALGGSLADIPRSLIKVNVHNRLGMSSEPEAKPFPRVAGAMAATGRRSYFINVEAFFRLSGARIDFKYSEKCSHSSLMGDYMRAVGDEFRKLAQLGH